MSKPIGKLLGAVYLGLTMLPVTQAIAQEAQTQRASAASAVMEEVIISAERRDSSLQDTALSVVAVTGDAMRARGITNTKDIGELAANLQLKEPDRIGQNRIFIRGIGGGNYNPIFVYGTGQYIDGHYIPGQVGNQMSTVDVERVEVLRGPQGTLFGKNVTGGAVNIISVKPQPEFGADVTLSVAEYGTKNLSGMVNVPFTDNLYGRFSAASEQTDGYYWNRYLDERQDWRDNKSYRAAFRWEPSANLTLDLAATYYDAEGGQNGVQCQIAPVPQVLAALEANGYGNLIDRFGWEATPDQYAGDGYGGKTWNAGFANGLGLVNLLGADATADFYRECGRDQRQGEFVTSSELRPVSWEKTDGLFFTAKWDSLGEVGFLDNLAVTLNSGTRETEHAWVIDLDYTPLPIFSISHHSAHQGVPGFFVDTKNIELLFDMTINEKANLIVGANYFDESQNTGDSSCIQAYNEEYAPNIDADPTLRVPCGPSVDDSHGGLQFGWVNTAPFSFLQMGFENVDTSTESKAVFAHLTYNLSENWELAVGSRWTEDERAFANIGINTGHAADTPTADKCLTALDTVCESRPVISAQNLQFANSNVSTYDAVTSMVSLTRHFENSMVYLLYSEGYLTGSFNDELDVGAYPALGPIAAYDPEYVDNIELGFKGTLFDGRLVLNADVFFMDYTDKQEQLGIENPLVDENDPSGPRWFGPSEDIEATVNAGVVEAKGIEVEIRATPWENGFLTLDLGTLDMDYKEFDFPDIFTPDGELVEVSGLDYTTRHIHNRTPDWTMNLGLGHTFYLGDGGALTPSINMYRQDSYEWGWDSLQFPFTPPPLDAPNSACFQDGYSKFRARVNYVPASEGWEASLFGNNITDERIINHCQWNRGGAIKKGVEAPRTWGVEFKAYF